MFSAPPPPYNMAYHVQNIMETIANGSEAKEELVFNPITGELEVVTPKIARSQTTKPVMTKIAKDGFFIVFQS